MAKSNDPDSNTANPNPPGVWLPPRKGVGRILAPLERFLAVEASSGILLMVAAIAALVWAKSPWRTAYCGSLARFDRI